MAGEEDTSYLKLPVEEKCVHKLWKARLSGYEEATKLFRQIDDEKSPEFSKYLGLVKKFVVDSNAIVQEKALEAVLAYVENYAFAGKTVGEVMSGIVAKCIAAPKTKTKELAIQVALMYVEIEKQEAVQEELLRGMEHKNPKIVAACISTTTLALREFGAKVIAVKPLVKKISALLEDRDKGVRDEAKAMVVEIFRWIGPALKPQLSSLKPVQVTELEAEFEKLPKEKAEPTRYLRSKQKRDEAAAAAAAAAVAEDEEGDDEADDAPEMDPLDLIDPVDILSQLPKDFYVNLEAQKWQERKEAVDAVEKLVQAPKFESGDYGDLVRALKKVITKDTNVMVVAVAGKCLAGLATGLKRKFQPYAGACIPAILEKFREKKQNVVLALREAIDAIYQSTTIEAVQEDVLAALENKNPSVKAETASFLARCFTRCTPQMLTKRILKTYTTALLKTLNEPDPTVRDNAAEALGTAMKAAGEKAIMPFFTDLDNLKLTKIKECCEKAVMLVEAPAVVERPSSAPSHSKASPKAGSSAPKPVKRPGSAAVAPKKQPAKKAAPQASGVKGKAPVKPVEKELSPEDLDEKAAEIFSEDMINGLVDTNWKTRLAAVEQLTEVIRSMDATDIPIQVVVRTLNKKPGLRDTNVQVAKARLETLKYVAEKVQMSSMVLDFCLTEVVEKLGDPKTTAQAGDTLTALAEATKLDIVATNVLNYAFSQKSPKLHQESLNWVSSAILDFGFVIQPKPLVEIVKKALAATNPVVRNSSISLLGTLYLYMGDDLRMLFDTEKPALQQQIFAEFDKHAEDVPPAPSRGLSRSAKCAQGRNVDEEVDYEDEEEAAQSVNVRELMPRVDISPQITDALVNELADKDWKVRNEAIQKLSNILTKEKFVTSSLGELPPVLAKRLVDSNGKIAVAAFTLCQQLGVAMGMQGKTHIRTFFPGLLQGMGDSKTWVRSAALACVNIWGDQCGFKEFFDGEMIADALKSGSPALRSELWTWLAEKLPTIPPKSFPKEELQACLPLLYANLEDRSSDVRKSAQEAILGFMMHLGYDSMMRATEKLPSASMTSVRTNLENVYPNLPSKPQVKKKGDAPAAAESAKTVKSGPAKPAGTKVGAKGKVVAKAGRKKDDDVDTSPLLQENNLKHQRSLDEHKLKVLKWNFSTPREEFVELLREQMTTANINKNLIANMLHSDFKYHLKAIDSLAEDLPMNPTATISNLDLILKWMTLRFFDTNPSVLLKGLEYLQTVFSMLIEEGYNMFDHEASSFLPYLILKIGDPKDAVRNGVRALFTQIRNVYPASKLFAYVMDGLKSKNARQRTECLDLLGSLIESYGLPVCQPSAGVAMKEVARQISDRDNSVRNAALNCIVQAYFLEGEKVYKLVGQISDKDMSLLEERIKRASKNRPPARVVQPPAARHSQVAQPMKQEPEQVCEDAMYGEAAAPVEMPEPAPIMRTTLPKPRPMSGPFGLDMNLLERIESNGVELRAPKLQEFDYEFLGSFPAVPPPKPAVHSAPPPIRNHEQITFSSCRTMEDTLDLVISNLKSPDVAMFRETIAQLDGLIQSSKAMLLLDQADQLVSAVVMQLHLLKDNNRFATDATQIPVCYRMSLMLLLSFFNNDQLARKVSRDVLKDLVEELITILVEERMEELEFNEQAIRVINLIVVRAIEKSDHTNGTCALITLLHEAVGCRSSTRFLDLAMKCLWKVIKLLPKWDGEVQYDVVLYEIHRFFKEYPPAMWKKQTSDTPLRTLKTILHTLVKMKGDKIYGYLGRINNLQESDLYMYLQKLTRSVKQDEGKHIKKESKSQHRLSKSVHEQLSEIFKKIGSKEDSKVGLALLYDFREQHPEADIEPFLRKSSQFFQDYIEQGLQQIEKERRRQLGREDAMRASSTSSLGSTDTMLTRSSDSVESAPHSLKSRAMSDMMEDCDPFGKNPTYYRERLRHLQAGAGLDPSALSPPPKNTASNEFDININRKPLLDRNDPPLLNPRSQTSTVDVENIRKRLEALKTAIKS